MDVQLNSHVLELTNCEDFHGDIYLYYDSRNIQRPYFLLNNWLKKLHIEKEF